MRRMITATKNAAKRVTMRLMLGGFATAAVGAAAWGGWSYMRPAAPKGPTKKIAIGVDAAAGERLRHPAVASLSDDPSTAARIENQVRQLQYSQPAESSSRRNQAFGSSAYGNPYLPTSNDPAGGSAGSIASAVAIQRSQLGLWRGNITV